MSSEFLQIWLILTLIIHFLSNSVTHITLRRSDLINDIDQITSCCIQEKFTWKWKFWSGWKSNDLISEFILRWKFRLESHIWRWKSVISGLITPKFFISHVSYSSDSIEFWRHRHVSSQQLFSESERDRLIKWIVRLVRMKSKIKAETQRSKVMKNPHWWDIWIVS